MGQRRGFTLVEMLVAVALVVLMMFLFAQVFSIATGAMSKQKGLAENDQRARLVTTVLQADLQKRVMRVVQPIYPGYDPPWPAHQQGYVYISENDPADDTDDVLQFPIITTNTLKNKDQTPLFGRAVPLVDPDEVPANQSVSQYALNNPNQPELDDGQVEINNTGTSIVGEVAYFVRNGVLYRRVMLIRYPYVGDVITPQSSDSPPIDLIDKNKDTPYAPNGSGNAPAYTPNSYSDANGKEGIFWRDFDYSAVNLAVFGGSYPDHPIFLGASAGSVNVLNNLNASTTVGQPVFSLGMPNMRWGHNVQLTGSPGRSREYVSAFRNAAGSVQGGDVFIGRFTHEETSEVDFQYPGKWVAASYPMTDPGLVYGTDGVIEKFRRGPRRGEDILLTNVHAFDIKVYDDHSNVMDFRDVGYTKGAQGFYCHQKCRNKSYGPRSYGPGGDGQPGEAGVNDDGAGGTDDAAEQGWEGTDDVASHVFDTWHPNFDSNGDGTIDEQDQPPFLAAEPGEDGQPGEANVNDDGVNGVDDAGELGYPNTDDVPMPLRSIQIRIRYLDTTSNQMRDLTLVQTLTD